MLLGIITSIEPAENVDIFEGVTVELYTAPLPVPANGDRPTSPPLLRTHVDDLGHIVFKPVPGGQYIMIVYLPDRELVIEDLTID